MSGLLAAWSRKDPFLSRVPEYLELLPVPEPKAPCMLSATGDAQELQDQPSPVARLPYYTPSDVQGPGAHGPRKAGVQGNEEGRLVEGLGGHICSTKSRHKDLYSVQITLQFRKNDWTQLMCQALALLLVSYRVDSAAFYSFFTDQPRPCPTC